MTERVQNWSRAYARQVISDLQVREMLIEQGAELCHRLHFLQMASEKVCKAHLSAGSDNQDVRHSHAYIAAVIPVLARQFYSRRNLRSPLSHWQVVQLRRLANEVELLAPACDAGESRPDNSEYPWLDAQGEIQTPCEYRFPNIDDRDKSITLLVKLLRAAADQYAV